MVDRSAPLVSVIIINFNYCRYLSCCIDSALGQTYAPIETVVVDDGSTDESWEIIRRYDSRVLAIQQQNGGMVAAMNRGFTMSKGDIVIFVDADDYLLPGAVERHVQAMRDATIVRSQITLAVHDEDTRSGEYLPGPKAEDGDLRQRTLSLGPGAYVSAPNSGNAWARSFLERMFPLPEQPRSIGAETYLMDAAPLFGRIAICREPHLGVYRRHGVSMNGTLGPVSPDNVARVLKQYEARLSRLNEVAETLGYQPSTEDWARRNWRLLTLRDLWHRTTGIPGRPGVSHLLRPAFAVQGAWWRTVALALVLLSIRVAPLPAARVLARPLVRLQYM